MDIMSHKTICICGGGSLGHALAATLGSKGHLINILSGRPEKWGKQMTAYDCKEYIIKSKLNKVSGNASDVIPESDIIILCVPGFLIESTIRKISPYINSNQQVGSVVCSNGFFWIAQSILGKNIPLFGFQRVPFICRVREYGKSVDIKGYKSLLKIAGLNNPYTKEMGTFFENSLNTPINLLGHFLEATLTNSNPILHPARIYAMLSSETSEIFDKEFLFYEEWDNKSSEVLIACDNEFQKILTKLPIKAQEIPPLLSYYDSFDADSLTQKIKSISAFKGIKMSMIKTNDGYKVDYSNRYFTEDIPYGLLIIKSIGILTETATPTIDNVVLWMQEKMERNYLNKSSLNGTNIRDTGIVQNFGIKTSKSLVEIS